MQEQGDRTRIRGLNRALAVLACAALGCVGLAPHASPARAVAWHTSTRHHAEIRETTLASSAGATALTIELNHTTSYRLFTLDGPGRVVLDLGDSRLASGVHLPRSGGIVAQLRAGARPHGGLRIVLQLDSAATPGGRVRLPVHAQWRSGCPSGARRARGAACLVVRVGALERAAHQRPPGASTPGAMAAPRIAELTHVISASHAADAPRITEATRGSPSAIQPSPAVTPASFTSVVPDVPRPIAAPHAPVLADRDVVIAVDAGHGGKDPGAIGRNGTEEKNVTLAIARALAARINDQPGMRAVLTRDSDVFLLLKDRRDRAREAHADLFVSVHADSIHDPTVSGASVYVLSERGATDEAANWLAERENAADRLGGTPLNDMSSTLKSVLIDLSQNESISASMTAAQGVIAALDQVGEVRKPRVQQAGFVVLKSPDIPSMLVETAYISNPGDERRLSTAREQHKLADAIFTGLLGYFEQHPPAGTRIARLAKRDSRAVLAADRPTTAAPVASDAADSSTTPQAAELAARP